MRGQKHDRSHLQSSATPNFQNTRAYRGHHVDSACDKAHAADEAAVLLNASEGPS
jgi:ABC-type nickel/cobalt efflux system permease component RcnA